MSVLVIRDALCVNEGSRFTADVLIRSGRIEKMAPGIPLPSGCEVLAAGGRWLLPGLIDDQVHFREPGLEVKGTIQSESRAALAGGVTSYMDMPNTLPETVTLEALEDKFRRAARTSAVNYSFYLGATNGNLETIRRIDPSRVCGVKVFMGASTGEMLVDDPRALEDIFREAPAVVATHCEDTPTIRRNEEAFRARYGEGMPFRHHAAIRSEEACWKSSSYAVELARACGTRLHVLHLSTAREMQLFDSGSMDAKAITAEACVHHLVFSEEDYDRLGARIKWNPSIKTAADREGLREAVRTGRIDVIATDHSPHTQSEKGNPYWSAPSGGPLVQHTLPVLLDLVQTGVFTLEQVVEKTSHAPARRFGVCERGFLREGYWADLVLVDPNAPWTVEPGNILYACGWSPFEGMRLGARVAATILNGEVAYREGAFTGRGRAMPLEFTPP